jgi:hypothetical protein
LFQISTLVVLGLPLVGMSWSTSSYKVFFKVNF